MDDWDDSPATGSSSTNTGSGGFGKSSLTHVLGSKVRGLGRGFGGGSDAQVNGFGRRNDDGNKENERSNGFGSRSNFGSKGDDNESFGGGRREGGGRGGGGGRPGDWICTEDGCGNNNYASRSECFKCRAVKPDDGSGGGSRSGGDGGRPGDWICTAEGCGKNNFASRSECFKCHAVKPDDGSGGQSRGGRGTKEGDWKCPDESCGNNNFAFRRQCQKCDTPKPDDGTGGGDSDKPREAPYVPPAAPDAEEDIFGVTIQKGINFDRYDDIPVEVSGRDQCGLVSSFEEADLFPTFLQNVKRAKFEKPTPIQKYAIPIVKNGRDLMACAQTGSGKTAAFLLPVLTTMIKRGLTTDEYQEVQAPQAICVAPTRELACQIYLDCRKFSYGTDIRPVVIYGGTSVGHQLREVEKGAHFIIGTPGRLLDFINRGKISLACCQFLILDEADRMLDMGFEPEIRKMVETMGMPSKTERQTLMFSATFPEEIQKLAADFLNDYLFVTVGRVGGANTDVTQTFFEVDRMQKRESLCDILNTKKDERTLVFVEQKRNADFLASYLCQSGFPTTSIHGDRLQREREEALRDFKKGKSFILVATSVAARGLDIPDVKHVVNYDLPSSIDEYVHRIGRTGRCGNLGKATSFFSSDTDQPLANHLLRILKEANQVVPEWLAEQASGMGGGDSSSYSGRFGGKDIRRGDKSGGDGRGDQGGDTWAAGTGTGGNDDEDWD